MDSVYANILDPSIRAAAILTTYLVDRIDQHLESQPRFKNEAESLIREFVCNPQAFLEKFQENNRHIYKVWGDKAHLLVCQVINMMKETGNEVLSSQTVEKAVKTFKS